MARKVNYEEKISVLEAKIEKKQSEIKILKAKAVELKAQKTKIDYQDLIDYMDQNPDVTGIEYDGQVRTREELNEIEDQRLRELFPEDFAES